MTGVGILEGAVVKGRLDLDSARGSCGPLCPLRSPPAGSRMAVPRATLISAGLASANVGFGAGDRAKDCDPAIDPAAVPTIDLAGARLDGQLDMDRIAPEVAGGLLWIRAPGLRVGGGINLTGCTLRAPASPSAHAEPDSRPEAGVEAPDALDLTLGRIKGDFSP